MNVFDRLSIGTANFGKEYNGVHVQPKEVEKILAFAWDLGIRSLDCAVAYEWDWNDVAEDFRVTFKVTVENRGIREGRAHWLMAHDYRAWNAAKLRIDGLSMYETKENAFFYAQRPKVVQCPYSIYDRRFETYFTKWNEWDTEVQVRSIFLRGKILKDEREIDPMHCMVFPLLNPNVDKVIIGVESLDQLKQNVEYFQWLDDLKVDDEQILDTRRWEQK